MRIFDANRLPRPTLPEELRDALLRPGFDLEIGAGQGLHAIRYCKENPDRRLVAVERTHARFAQLRRRQEAHPELTNLHAIQADAISIVAHFVQPQIIKRIFLLYPNPYPKSRQANLRWHNMPFAGELIAKLETGGELTLATNIASYAIEAREVFDKTWGLRLKEDRTVGRDEPPRTHFEKKYLDRGEICHNLVFIKD